MNRKLLKTIGIALIVFPEPTLILDVVGLGLVGLSYIGSENLEDYVKFRNFLEYYRNGLENTKCEDRPPVHHTLNQGHVTSPGVSPEVTPSERLETMKDDDRPIVYHTLKRDYKSPPAVSPEIAPSEQPEKNRTLKRQLMAEQYNERINDASTQHEPKDGLRSKSKKRSR